jgi:ATP-dependent Clp protease adaptor protein ClpS
MESFSKHWQREHLSENKGGKKALILHNDSINSFEYVIETLCGICGHDYIQAEQCAYITHFKGSCEIKVGSFEKLVSLKNKLENKKLLVTID